MGRRRYNFFILVGLIFLIPFITACSQGEIAGELEMVKSFSAENNELPEGLVTSREGDIYASLGPPFFVGGGYGAIWKISQDGKGAETLIEFPEGPAPAGLAVDESGNLYFALPNPGGPDGGVYRLSGQGRQEILEGSENIVLPNGLAFNKAGDLFVSDSILGAVWRLPGAGADPAETWLQHDMLAGCPEDVGANGIAFWEDSLYVANTSKGILVQVPVLEDGAPGDPRVVAGSDDCEQDGLFGLDGIALDEKGNVYALLVLQNKLVKIDPSGGNYTELLTGEDGLWNPASIAFGAGKGDRKSVYITNYAVIPPGSDKFGPALLKYGVEEPGLPTP